jgi:peptidoglycan/xylan/chitin deacetylase (PgdA/CDA1 family)
MTVYCYHSVRDDWRSPLAVEPSAFSRHLDWLARRKRVVDLSEAVAAVLPSGRLRSGRVALTFDDGLSDLYDNAFPILVRNGLSATVFVVAETLTPEGRPVDWVNDPPPSPLRTLTVDQILEMQERGIRFGSHSYAHRDLTELTVDECLRDLRSSRELLEDLLETSVPYLAYPGGHHDERVRNAAAHAGFSHAFGTLRGRAPVTAHAIPRVGIYANDEAFHLRLKSAAGYIRLRRSRTYHASRNVAMRAARPRA